MSENKIDFALLERVVPEIVYRDENKELCLHRHPSPNKVEFYARRFCEMVKANDIYLSENMRLGKEVADLKTALEEIADPLKCIEEDGTVSRIETRDTKIARKALEKKP